ncbi:MAG: hypothetical protein QXU99_00100 [Candidatus Bathyarchaeia archaeon]
MRHKIKANKTKILAFLVLAIAIALVPMAQAAGAITLTPPTQGPGGAITVTGTGFGATKAVGIGFGAEVNATGEAHTPTGTGTGPYTARTNHYPIKPGSFSMHSNVGGVESDWIDLGNGTIAAEGFAYAAPGFINYVTGEFGRSSTADLTGYEITFTVSYTYYTYNVTPTQGVTTNSAGAFSASITLPSVANGNYVVTAVDTAGNIATATLNVVPEGLTIGVMLVLSTTAVIVSRRYLGKIGIKRQQPS